MWPLMFLSEGVKSLLPSKLLKYQMCSEKRMADLSCRVPFFPGENRRQILVFTEVYCLLHTIIRKAVGMESFP